MGYGDDLFGRVEMADGRFEGVVVRPEHREVLTFVRPVPYVKEKGQPVHTQRGR